MSKINSQYPKNHTLWKFKNFNVTQILREIKVREYRCSKTANLTFFEFWFDDFLFISWGLKFTKIKICSLKNCRIRRFWEPKIAKIDLLLEITKFYSKSQIVLTTAVSFLWRCKSILKLNSIKYLLDAIFWTFLRYCIKLFSEVELTENLGKM